MVQSMRRLDNEIRLHGIDSISSERLLEAAEPMVQDRWDASVDRRDRVKLQRKVAEVLKEVHDARGPQR